jgi:Fe-S-cluster containining protein
MLAGGSVKVDVTIPFKRIMLRATPKEQKQLWQMLKFYEKQFSGIDKSDHQREGIADGIHASIDKLVIEIRQRDPGNAAKVACKKGCAHCCYTEVGITRDEALLLHHAAQEAGIKIDAERLRAQAAHEDKKWPELDYKQRGCVFLSADNTCGVYEHRPTACRKYMVVGDPKQCDSREHYGAKVGVFTNPEAEVLHCAALRVLANGSMARMLLETSPAKEP